MLHTRCGFRNFTATTAKPTRVGIKRLPLYPTAKLLTDCYDVITLFSARYSKFSEKKDS